MAQVLSSRELNRATLARQLLLRREKRPAAAAVEHLVGLQAQEPGDPYVALWTRLEGFDPEELSRLLAERRAVRTALMRATIHLVTARDCLAFRPLFDPVLARVFGGTPFAKNADGVDLPALLAEARALMDERPRTRGELGRLLAESRPGRDPNSLSHAVGYLMPGVQVPPRGLWGRTGQATWATTESWLGPKKRRPATPADTILRYLAAFGPASVSDARTWSGLTGLRAIFEELRPRLVTFRAESGTELFDLPDAPRPPSDTPAPVRFLPQYDNVLLGYADRSRFVAAGARQPLFSQDGRAYGLVLVDGHVRSRWKLVRHKTEAHLVLESARPLARNEAGEVDDEASRLLAFLAPGTPPAIEHVGRA